MERVPTFFEYAARCREELSRAAKRFAWEGLMFPAIVALLNFATAVAYGLKPEWRRDLLPFLLVTSALLAAWVLFHLVRVPWKLDQGRAARINEIDSELRAIKDGAPKLICMGVTNRKVPIRTFFDGMTGSPPAPGVFTIVTGEPFFYHLKIINEPTGITDRKAAEKVAARVQILNKNGTAAAPERIHRWEDSDEPVQVGKKADRLVPQDILPSGVEHYLDIAMKYDEDECFYTTSNETTTKGIPDWRDKDFEFPPGTYLAAVHLRGINVSQDIQCQIVNKGKGTKLEITPLNI